MDQIRPPLRPSYSNLGLNLLLITFIGLASMSHSAIKDPQQEYNPDHVASQYSSQDISSGTDRKRAPCTGNCEPRGKMEVRVESLLKEEVVDTKENGIYAMNETEQEDPERQNIVVKVSETEDEHHWKVKVIIVCTVAASIEIVIVVFILIYWKDIRWSMRKMYCPCDERRVRRHDHQAMEPSGPSPSDSGFQGDDLEQGQHVQTYQTRRENPTEDPETLEEQPLQTSVV